MTRAAGPRPRGVEHAALRRLPPPDEAGRVVVEGVLVLDGRWSAALTPQLLVDGNPVTAAWGLRSPAVAERFEGAGTSERARFRSAGLEVRGRVELAVVDAAGRRTVLATRVVGDPRVERVRARVARLADEDEQARDATTYATLRRTLSKVPDPDRDVRWVEARVLVDGLFRRHPKATHRRLEQLRAAHAAAGTETAFDDLWADLGRATRPHVLVRHGYRFPLSARDADEVWAEVARLGDRLAALGHPTFVNSGTLLGLVRDGRLIAHDDDVDLAVVLRGDSLPEVVRAWNDLKAQLADAGLLRTDPTGGSRTHCKLVSSDGLGVDVFPAWVIGGRAHVWPHTPGDVAATDLLPLAERLVHGSTVRLPRHPVPFLERNYGPGWSTSDPSFRFDWARARERFADFVAEIDRQDPRQA
ncbi:hypothetical protein H5V45_00185 [Nocardioides sp. KIGAM211]|uniref:LicD family protein n=1 Tax=Nocardioides luti TaxID=2761101 RepID=A0A7X0VA48_9ACTN|nr:hypothetical protein [Nocardioides luti]MBB6625723.1 hypothetical protein [Nocardioides luti]